ncbi:MAG: phosphoglucomutase/phosphomannomutase family protein [Faecalibacterium sp.]|jgi:phosphomannomutase|nr:phosphoglucomutase/phosphomannomutase family protein [Faecalibacterium sp.]
MIHFGTGGWRAVIGDDFTKSNVQLLAAALAKKMQDDGVAEKGIVIGYDRRFLSEVAAGWAGEAFAAAGIPCSIIRRQSPTPLVMYAVRQMGLPYGLAVTASHNPAIYNGIKVFMQGGRDADEPMTQAIEGYIGALAGSQIPTVEQDVAFADGRLRYIDPMNEYIDGILAAVNTDAIRGAHLHVVLDPMYGVSKTALQTILLTARCDVSVIHERRDTLFGGRLPAPNEKTLASLINYVEENHCDIGIATDGDADRLGVIDDQAVFLHPNKILVLLYYYLIEYKGWHGAAVRNIATTHLLDRIAEAFGETCYEVPVGFKYISGKMASTGAIIGGESSGGLTVRGHIQGKDGIYAASLLIEMIATTGKSLSSLWAEIEQKYGRFEMSEHDFRFTQEKKAEIHKLLMEDKLLPAFPLPIDHVSYLDGCKVYFQNGGWIIARFSGTEPLLRIFCEMDDLQKAESLSAVLQKFLHL